MGLSQQDREALRLDLHHMFGAHADIATNEIQPTVEAIVARHVASALNEAADAIKVRRARAWRLYLEGPGGATEALRQGRVDGLDAAVAIVRAAANDNAP